MNPLRIFTLLFSSALYSSPLLPPEPIESTVEIEGGMSNAISLLQTAKGRYILRTPKEKIPAAQFSQVIEACEKIGALEIGPSLISYNAEEQSLLMQYVQSQEWPAFEKEPLPYLLTARTLRRFHESLQPPTPHPNATAFYPFSYLFTAGEKLIQEGRVPPQYITAIESLKEIYTYLAPWLQKYATFCHCDFHLKNVLLDQESKTPVIIDLDSLDLSHPFFDIVKFTAPLTAEQRHRFFCEYLGKEKPAVEEELHFECLDLALLLLVATCRFESLLPDDSSLMSNKEMQELLETEVPLPSFMTLPYPAPSMREKQLSALYALDNFLRKHKTLSHGF